MTVAILEKKDVIISEKELCFSLNDNYITCKLLESEYSPIENIENAYLEWWK